MTSSSFVLPDEAATVALAGQIAALACAGDVIRLQGDLGAGKSTFARAFIRAMGTQSAYIPSPTFTLVQVYEDTRLPVAHLDCYRLEEMGELEYLGLEDVQGEGILLVEWSPASLQHHVDTAGTLTLRLTPETETSRAVTVDAQGTWSSRFATLDV